MNSQFSTLKINRSRVFSYSVLINLSWGITAKPRSIVNKSFFCWFWCSDMSWTRISLMPLWHPWAFFCKSSPLSTLPLVIPEYIWIGSRWIYQNWEWKWYFLWITVYLFNTVLSKRFQSIGHLLCNNVHYNYYHNYTKILEVKLFAFAFRLFRKDFSPIDGALIITRITSLLQHTSKLRPQRQNLQKSNHHVQNFGYIFDAHWELLIQKRE